jgi:malonyl-ACP O-methyltransferase BioC
MQESINSSLVMYKFGKSMDTYDDNAFAQKKIAKKLTGLISDLYPGIPETIMEIGCGTGLLTKSILSVFPDAHYYLNDINDKSRQWMRTLFAENSHTFIGGDARLIDFPDRIDLLISSSTIQWFENLSVFAEKAYRSLSPQAYMFLSTFGKNNLKEIREITGTGLDYLSLDGLRKLFSSSGFEILHLSGEEIQVAFDSPSEILSHFRRTGVNANCSGTVRTKSGLKLFCSKYSKMFSDGTKVILTYNPVFLGLKKK